MLRSFLLAPCLLICLACVTPFPFENLEEGMTTETLRERFGEPDFVTNYFVTNWSGNVSGWTYVHEERDWADTIFYSTVFLPMCIWISAITLPLRGEIGCNSIDETKVVLHVVGEELLNWDVIKLDNPWHIDWTAAYPPHHPWGNPATEALHRAHGHTFPHPPD